MSSADDRILTTHVGSLVRPPALAKFLEKIESGEAYDRVEHEVCLRESVAGVVRQQADAGVDIVSDGEFSKTENWAWYVHSRISGFTERPATPEEAADPLVAMTMGRDFREFPEFYAEYFPTQGFKVRPVSYVTVCN